MAVPIIIHVLQRPMRQDLTYGSRTNTMVRQRRANAVFRRIRLASVGSHDQKMWLATWSVPALETHY